MSVETRTDHEACRRMTERAIDRANGYEARLRKIENLLFPLVEWERVDKRVLQAWATAREANR